jgi:hypothetical protein
VLFLSFASRGAAVARSLYYCHYVKDAKVKFAPAAVFCAARRDAN